MKGFYKVLLLIVLAGLVAGAVFLSTWDMPPPTAQHEEVIPHDRFQKS